MSDVLNAERSPFTASPKDYSLTLAKGIAILEMFGTAQRSVTFQSAADHLGTSRATARRLIMTLQALGYLERAPEGYQLTARCLMMSRSFLTNNRIIPMLAARVRQLAAEIDCPSSIVSLNGADVMFLCRDPSRRVYASQLALGDRLPAHASSGGKLLLSTRTDSDIRNWIETFQPQRFTARTITDPDDMIAAARGIRADGYATSDGELEDGLISLAVPIRDHSGAIKLGLVISQFAKRMSTDEIVATCLDRAMAASQEMSSTYADFLLHNA